MRSFTVSPSTDERMRELKNENENEKEKEAKGRYLL